MSANISIPRPRADEHSPYYSRYIDQVPTGDLIALLREQLMETVSLLQGVSGEKENYAYAPGKWSIKQVIGHIIDAERVFTYRAMSFARKEKNKLPSFDENSWVDNGRFEARTLADLVEELQVVRAATIHFAKHLNDEELARVGIASDNAISVRALLYIAAGHERHHAALLRERYLSGI